LRAFLDTNVLVSAFATRGLCPDLFRHVLAEHDLVLGEVVVTELLRVLRDRLRLPKNTIHDIETFLREYELVPKPDKPHDIDIRDPDDAWIIASALAGRADVIVTGDDDLLGLGKRSPIRVQTPRQFWTTASQT
jgi:putative PIN family toxin of toxin-antitoxin system